MTQGDRRGPIRLRRRNWRMDRNEFRDEVRSFFASGTCTQELYITPQKLSGRELGRPGRGRPVVARPRRRAGRHALARRRSGQGRGIRLGGVDAAPGDAGAAQSERPGGRFDVDVGRAFELPKGAARAISLEQSVEERRRARAGGSGRRGAGRQSSWRRLR